MTGRFIHGDATGPAWAEASVAAELAYAHRGEPPPLCLLAHAREPSILEEAQTVTDGERQDRYGHPSVNHSRTAGLWEAYLAAKGVDVTLAAEDVCWMNVLQKIARELHSQTRDSLVDVAGYAANVDQIRNT